MRPSTSRSALPMHTSTRAWLAKCAREGQLDDVGDALHVGRAHRAPAPDRGEAPARAAPALGLVALGHEQAVDPVLAQGLERRRQAGDGLAARRPHVAELRDQRGLGPALDALLQLQRHSADLVLRGLHRQRHRLGQASAQVRVQRGVEVGSHLDGRADDEVLEPHSLVHVEGQLGGGLHVLVVLLGQLAALARLEALAAVVVALAGQLVEPLAVLDELTELEHEHAGPLTIGEQHADALVLLEQRLQLAHARHRLDHELAGDPHGQLVDLPEPAGRAREHGQPARAATRHASHVLLHAVDVLAHRERRVAAGAAVQAGRPDELAQLPLHLTVGRQPPTVHVEVAAGDRNRLAPEARQRPHRVLGEQRHVHPPCRQTPMLGPPAPLLERSVRLPDVDVLERCVAGVCP